MVIMWNTTGFGLNPAPMSTPWAVASNTSETVFSSGNEDSSGKMGGVGEQHIDQETEVVQGTVSGTKEEEVPEEQQVEPVLEKSSEERREVRGSTVEQNGPSVGEAVSKILEVFLREQVKPLMAGDGVKKDVIVVANGVSELTKQFAAMRTEFHGLSSTVREHMATEVADLQCRLSKSEGEANALRLRVSELEHDGAEASKKLATRKERIQDLIGQVQQLKSKVDDLESQQVQSVSSETSAGPDKGEGRPSDEVRRERRRRHVEKNSDRGERKDKDRERKRSEEDERRARGERRHRHQHQRRPSRPGGFFGF